MQIDDKYIKPEYYQDIREERKRHENYADLSSYQDIHKKFEILKRFLVSKLAVKYDEKELPKEIKINRNELLKLLTKMNEIKYLMQYSMVLKHNTRYQCRESRHGEVVTQIIRVTHNGDT